MSAESEQHLDLDAWARRHIIEEAPAEVRAIRQPTTYCGEEHCRTQIEPGRERCLHHSDKRYRDAA